ncbi:MAG: nitronate monooxygenase [Planctomycetota bacterium]|nr:nitronate monooxygenase [Planctomycetota bacterium]MDG2143559.1 nitronate monooxygenase [Planctomycetota bacterium]
MSSKLRTVFTQDAGVDVPLLCGAMYPCGNPELVAAVSEAGGLGVVQPISFAYVHSGSLKVGLERVADLTQKPVAFNAIIEKGSKKYERAMNRWIEEALDFGIRFFITALGNPAHVVKLVHEAGGIVYHDVTERRFAQKAHDSGVNGLIAVNRRAGGHAGIRSAKELLGELGDLGLPVIGAGGVGDERAFVEMLNLGYAGVQMGTRFIATPECKVHADYRQAIVDSDEQDIVLTKRLSGIDVAVIRRGSIVEMEAGEPGAMLSWFLRQPRTKHWARTFLALRSLRALKRSSKSAQNKLGYGDVYQAGKSVAGVHEIEPAAAIVQRFRNELEAQA